MLLIVAVISIVIGLTVGAVVGVLWNDRKARASVGDQQAALAVAQQQAAEANRQLATERQATESLRQESLESQKQQAALRAQLESAEKHFAEQRKTLQEAEEKLRESFASLSASALSKNNEAFLQLAQEKFASLATAADGSLQQRKAEIDGLLKPMHEALRNYQTRLVEMDRNRQNDAGQIREQVGALLATNQTLREQTTQLVSALRRPTTRGQWGEVTLRRLVELAGMAERCDFCEQISVDTEDGKQRPDMIVQLPGERQVVIDCKATLDAFLDAASAADDSSRKTCLQRHAGQVRRRASELSRKEYWNQFKSSPEFVVMFLPGEAFLYSAVEHDPGLIEDFFKNRVIVATPTTLLPLLKTIEFGWRQEQMAENAEEIRKHGKDLYDRIAVLLNHFTKLGASLDQSVKVYNDTMASMESRVMVTARKIGELGARTDKELPPLQPIERRARELSAAVRELPSELP